MYSSDSLNIAVYIILCLYYTHEQNKNKSTANPQIKNTSRTEWLMSFPNPKKKYIQPFSTNCFFFLQIQCLKLLKGHKTRPKPCRLARFIKWIVRHLVSLEYFSFFFILNLLYQQNACKRWTNYILIVMRLRGGQTPEHQKTQKNNTKNEKRIIMTVPISYHQWGTLKNDVENVFSQTTSTHVIWLWCKTKGSGFFFN